MRRKRVQVGWFCDHNHERLGEGTHMSTHGRWRRGKYQETYPCPNTHASLAFLDHRDPKQRPHCQLAEPIYVYRTPDGTQD